MHLLNSHGLYHDMCNPLKSLHFNALDADFISIHVSKNSIRLKQYLDEYLTQFGWIFIVIRLEQFHKIVLVNVLRN